MLRRRVEELERELARMPPSHVAPCETPSAEHARPFDMLFSTWGAEHSALLDAIPAMVFFKDRSHRYIAVNKAYADHYRLPIESIVGKRDEEIFDADTAQGYRDNDEAIMASGVPRLNVELTWKLDDGTDGWTLENNVPFRDESGRVMGMVGVVIDITERKRVEAALRSTEIELRATKERLLETIAALSTPVLPIDDGVLVLPIVGHIDEPRSSQLMAALLDGVQYHNAAFVILDLTGVPIIDSAVAQHLLRAAQAVRLLGAQCVLVGLSAAAAQSLVHTGEALQGLVILRDLRAGVRYVMARRTEHAGQRAAV